MDHVARRYRGVQGGEAGVLDTPEDSTGHRRLQTCPRKPFPVDRLGNPLDPHHREALRLIALGVDRALAKRAEQER